MSRPEPVIEFFFDCSSPWTYIAFRNLLPLVARLKVAIAWRPVLVGGIFNAVNPGVYAAREDWNSAKNRHVLKDVQDCARNSGVVMHFPPKIFPVNSVKAMRCCLWIAQDPAAQPKLLAFIEAVFAAYFTGQEDISSDEVLGRLCSSVGVDPQACGAGMTWPSIKDQLKANTDEAMRRGAFGSPTFFIGDDMYFGNDRLPLVEAAVRQAACA